MTQDFTVLFRNHLERPVRTGINTSAIVPLKHTWTFSKHCQLATGSTRLSVFSLVTASMNFNNGLKINRLPAARRDPQLQHVTTVQIPKTMTAAPFLKVQLYVSSHHCPLCYSVSDPLMSLIKQPIVIDLIQTSERSLERSRGFGMWVGIPAVKPDLCPQHTALTPAQKEYLYTIAASYSTTHVRNLITQHYLNVLRRCTRTGEEKGSSKPSLSLMVCCYGFDIWLHSLQSDLTILFLYFCGSGSWLVPRERKSCENIRTKTTHSGSHLFSVSIYILVYQ